MVYLKFIHLGAADVKGHRWFGNLDWNLLS